MVIFWMDVVSSGVVNFVVCVVLSIVGLFWCEVDMFFVVYFDFGVVIEIFEFILEDCV